MEQNQSKRQISTTLIAILAILVVIGLVLYSVRGKIHDELATLKLVPVPERFTELYFDDPTALPKNTIAGVPVSFSFTIHNLEGATTTYPFAVYFEGTNGAQTPLQYGTSTLDDNATTSVKITHTFLQSNEVGRVVINLTSLNQKIDFLLPNNI